MKKRLLTMLLAATMVCTLLVGCGDSGASNNDTSNNYNDDYIPTPDDVQDAFDQVEQEQNKDKYSESEYTKVTIYPYKPKRENEIDYLVQDLKGNSINWVRDWEKITVDFYIPNELVGEVTYNENNTVVYVTITKKYEDKNDLLNGELMQYKLTLDIFRDGYSESGVESCAIKYLENEFNRLVYNKVDDYKIVKDFESNGTSGYAKFIYQDEVEFTPDPIEGYPAFYGKKYISLSEKCTARMNIHGYDVYETKVNEYHKFLSNPELLYEVLDAIKIELNDGTIQ